jgi:hypothetical protein
MWNNINKISDSISIITIIVNTIYFVVLNRKLKSEEKRKSTIVKVYLVFGGDEIKLPGSFIRFQLTRQEIFGRLGILCKPFKVPTYLSKETFFDKLETVVNGHEISRLDINCTEDEFNQFKI